MHRFYTVLSLVLAALAVVVALGISGTAGMPRTLRDVENASQDPGDFKPRYVTVTGGWLPWGRHDPRPAFDVRNCPVIEEIYDLLPARDEIAALYAPPFEAADTVEWLADNDPVLSLVFGDEARCYPLAIMNWHSLVHDQLAGQHIHVFWDPPSGLGMARAVGEHSRPMGIAGLGFRGMGLVYERDTGALWDLFGGMQLSFPTERIADGVQALVPSWEWLPLEQMTWGAWKQQFADGQVLSRNTGHDFDYTMDPYAYMLPSAGAHRENYWTSGTILAPGELHDPTGALPDKTWVLGVLVGAEAWALPLDVLAGDTDDGEEMTFTTAAGTMRIIADPQTDYYRVEGPDGSRPAQVRLFWFAWKARFPTTRLYQPQEAILAQP